MRQLTDLFKFKGKDGSMGFETGKIYLLDVVGNKMIKTEGYPPRLMPCIEGSSPITMPRGDILVYESWEAFFENWERV